MRRKAPHVFEVEMPQESEQDRIARLLRNDERRKQAAAEARQKKKAIGYRRFTAEVPGDIYREYARKCRDLLATMTKEHERSGKSKKVDGGARGGENGQQQPSGFSHDQHGQSHHG